MAGGKLRNLSIRGIICALPDNKVLTVSREEQFGKETVDKIIESTGITSTYRVLPRQTASDLCFCAAENLIKKLGWNKEDIDILIFTSHAPDYKRPATACVLQGRLGLGQDCMAFDIGLGCSGFVYGMSVIGAIMQNPDMKKGLLLLGDMSSIATDPDTTNNLLFGDCGAAVAIERNEECEDIDFLLKTDGARYQSLLAVGGGYRHRNNHNDYCYMDGNNVFSFSISDVVKTIKEFMVRCDIQLEDIDMLALHQANSLIMKNIAKKCKISLDKVPISIDHYGNTSSSSIPLAIVDSFLKDNAHKKEKYRVIASGYGLGLSWGVMSFVLESSMEIGRLYTKEYFDDGHYGEGEENV